MKRATFWAAGVVLAAGAMVLTGCETGRVNKLHSNYEMVQDLTTVPHPNAQFASVVTENPPVPGSPTAAGADGTQPQNDNEARVSPGAEHGIPMYPRSQPVDAFVRQ